MLHQVSLESLASRWLTVQSWADPSAAPVSLLGGAEGSRRYRVAPRSRVVLSRGFAIMAMRSAAGCCGPAVNGTASWGQRPDRGGEPV
jgi:hypothetical protein